MTAPNWEAPRPKMGPNGTIGPDVGPKWVLVGYMWTTSAMQWLCMYNLQKCVVIYCVKAGCDFVAKMGCEVFAKTGVGSLQQSAVNSLRKRAVYVCVYVCVRVSICSTQKKTKNK